MFLSGSFFTFTQDVFSYKIHLEMVGPFKAITVLVPQKMCVTVNVCHCIALPAVAGRGKSHFVVIPFIGARAL